MAYMLALGPCIGCKQMFTFNPERVPSVTVQGRREPVCRHCMEQVNARRRENGLPDLPILPGAYDAEEVS